MLIALEQRDQVFRGILGQTATQAITATATPTATPTVIVTPTFTPTPTPTPTVTPNGGGIVVQPVYTVITSPADYAKHALEYAFRVNGLPLTRRGSRTALPQSRYNAILDYAVEWAEFVPKKYVGLTDGKRYQVDAGTAERYTSRKYLERYLTAYYNYSLAAEIMVEPTPAIIPRPTPTAFVRRVLTSSAVPIMGGSLNGQVYDSIVRKVVGDLQYTEYTSKGKSAPAGVTYDQIRAQYRSAVISVLNSIGIKRGSTTQSPDFLPTAGTSGTSPIPYSRQREWWAASDRGRAEWAAKEAMRKMGIRYAKGSTIITEQQASQILSGTRAFLQAVASDPVFVRDSGDQRDMQIALSLVNANLLGNMGIKVGDKPDWQERARAAVKFYLDRYPDRTMTEAEYREHVLRVANLAQSYWKNVAAYYRAAGGALLEPSIAQIRAYVDQQLKPLFTVSQTVTPTGVVSLPYIPRGTTTVIPAPTPTPTATPTIAALQRYATNALSTVASEMNIRAQSQAVTYGSTTYYRVPSSLFNTMIQRAKMGAVLVYSHTAYSKVYKVTVDQWEQLVLNAARVARFSLTVGPQVTPTPALTIPTTTYIPRPTITDTLAQRTQQLINQLFATILPKHGLAQRYPAAYYIPDPNWRAILGDLEALAAAGSRDAVYQTPAPGRPRLEQEMRSRNIFPESEEAVVTPFTTVVSREVALREWAANAPIFENYAQCRAAAEGEVGRVPDRWRDCLTEDDMIDQSVTLALTGRGIRPYPGALEMSQAQFDLISQSGYIIAQAMVDQRTYSPTVGGRVLLLAQ